MKEFGHLGQQGVMLVLQRSQGCVGATVYCNGGTVVVQCSSSSPALLVVWRCAHLAMHLLHQLQLRSCCGSHQHASCPFLSARVHGVMDC